MTALETFVAAEFADNCADYRRRILAAAKLYVTRADRETGMEPPSEGVGLSAETMWLDGCDEEMKRSSVVAWRTAANLMVRGQIPAPGLRALARRALQRLMEHVEKSCISVAAPLKGESGS